MPLPEKQADTLYPLLVGIRKGLAADRRGIWWVDTHCLPVSLGLGLFACNGVGLSGPAAAGPGGDEYLGMGLIS